jgi:uncharacterized protein involved in exopolysaccharide biosynthesis
MSIGQFLVILWARRTFIAAATVSCLVGALIVCMILPPRWESSARVMLNYIKPDPVTGEVIAGASARAYVATQSQLVTDYTVAGKVAERIGWLTDPNLIARYNHRSSSDLRDFRRWLADLVIQSTKTRLIEGSNILEITYTGPSSATAKAVAEALRGAYIDATLDFRHEDAERNAAWYTNEMAKAKQSLDDAVAAETAFEKANGLVMEENKLDAESARLQALTTEGAPLATPLPPTGDDAAAETQLASIEAELTSAQRTLGPNNPDILALQSKRAALQALVARAKANAEVAAARMAAGGAAALGRELAEQKAKVIGKAEQIGKLNELHQDVELRRTEYEHVSSKAAEYREEASSADAGVTSLGTAATPKEPVFPNYWLIVPGSIAGGMAIGVLLSLLMELMGRRVRSAADLTFDESIPVICVIPAPEGEPGKRKRGRGAGWGLRPSRQGVVGA